MTGTINFYGIFQVSPVILRGETGEYHTKRGNLFFFVLVYSCSSDIRFSRSKQYRITASFSYIRDRKTNLPL